MTRDRREVERAGKECDLPRKAGRGAGSRNVKRSKGKRDEKQKNWKEK